MYFWRVTKYDPVNRDADGSYLDHEEWTSFSEIGIKVNTEEYLKTEQNYINAISEFMDEMGLDRVHVFAVEQWSDEVESENVNESLSKIWVGKAITAQEVRELAKLTLRNVIWCKLGYKKQFFIHFGYDYYMYIEASKNCIKSKNAVMLSGLFVEEFDLHHQEFLLD